MNGQVSSAEQFYVYDLIDPRDGRTYYVGKGRGNRHLHHLKEALSGKRSRKCDHIRSILDSGHEYKSEIVEWFDDEQAALDAEAGRISEFGLEQLTNVLPNGWVYVPSENVSDPSRLAKPYIQKNYIKIAVMNALIEEGYRFNLGDFDITELVKTAIGTLRSMAGEEFFEGLVGGVQWQRA